MDAFPSPQDLVQGTGLAPSSHLQKVLLSELERLPQLPSAAGSPRAPLSAEECGPFESALRDAFSRAGGAIIAEYKQGSPSLGPFAAGTSLQGQLTAYREGGAACFSILAEPRYFQGSSGHIAQAAELGVPSLYKGFVISEGHLFDAAASGAQAALLIARVLKEHTAIFAEAARALGLEPLVELHDLTEIPTAQASRARLVGINARDLSTFTLGAPSAAPLRKAFPNAVLIRESGLATPEDAVEAFSVGFDAVLIGEALMRSANPKGFLERILAGARTRAAS
ncbi:MAG: indole-3-glycerol-phosphate synthase [Holophagaceae bacterium]|nr:indole-3-glycerol-phosphate synthase [Holophagaceae bacterium]